MECAPVGLPFKARRLIAPIEWLPLEERHYWSRRITGKRRLGCIAKDSVTLIVPVSLFLRLLWAPLVPLGDD